MHDYVPLMAIADVMSSSGETREERGRTWWKAIPRWVRPEELLAAPFLLLGVGLYAALGLRPRFYNSFVHCILALAVIYVDVFALIRVIEHLRSRRPVRELWASARRIRPLAVARDWAPWLVILLVYENLHDLVPYLTSHDRDAELLGIDRWLFGNVHVTVLLEPLVSPAMTTVMGLLYMSFFFYPAILGLALYRRPDKAGWRVLMMGMSLVAFSGYTLYMLVPAVGPLYAMADAYTVDLQRQALAGAALRLHDALRVSRDVFPSLHVAFTALYLLIARRYAPRLFWWILPFVLGLWFSTLYLRFHYVIDLIAGAALAAAAYRASLWICRRWYGNFIDSV